MKAFLRTNENNYHALKVLIASELTKISVEYDRRSVSSAAGRKCLLGGNAHFLFSHDDLELNFANSACRYLFALKGEASREIDQWLEWSAISLQPSLSIYLVEAYDKNKLPADLSPHLKKTLQYLNDKLNRKSFLVNTEVSVVDVVVWSELYPLFGRKDFARGTFSSFPNVSKWFDDLHDQEAFLKSAKILTDGKGPKVLNDYIKNMRVLSAKVCSEEKVTENEEKEMTKEEIKEAIDSWQNGADKLAPPKQRLHPILPQKGERNILITSALPYVNNVPHLGNIIGCVLSADVYSRFCRLRNYNSIYICGTDEYGTATETKALEEGITPKEICDKYHALHTKVYDWFNIDFDHFGRTTTDLQTKICQDMFWKLEKNKEILQDSVEQLFCSRCSKFLADRFVNGTCPMCLYDDARGDQCDKCGKLINATELKDPKCKICKSTPITKSTDHLFLNLPNLESRLKVWLDEVTEKNNWSNTAKVIAKSWLKEGLKPRCITRDLKWGTPVPLQGYQHKVFYVWYDAPIGYISITAAYTSDYEKWWKRGEEEVELNQFMAKDNVLFHSIIFPAIQMGCDDRYTTVKNLLATEYLNYEDKKFSKSRNVGVFGTDAMESGIPADIWRFYLLFIRPENQDSAFSWTDFMTKNNSEMLNNLGNFINRSLSFLFNNFDGVVPEMSLNEDDRLNLVRVTRELVNYINCLELVKEKDGIKHILNVSRIGNQIMQAAKPWQLIKGTEQERARAGTVIGFCCNIACLLSVMLKPYMPKTSESIQSQLNAPSKCNVLVPKFVKFLPPGHKINKPEPLFKKIEAEDIEKFQKKFAGAEDEKKPEVMKGDQRLIEDLTKAVADQGVKVREMKQNKASKEEVNAQVSILLELKKKLVDAGGQILTNKESSKSKKKTK